MGKLDFEYKTINDPVHGSIKVSKVELAVINSISFQRLRGLKQLGLADFVFPGATHTRFAHSLGVLYIVSEMLTAIENNHRKRHKNGNPLFTQEEKQKIRLAALLHDIGHLPLSHAMEHPIQRFLLEKATRPLAISKSSRRQTSKKFFGDLDQTANADLDEGFSHERYGAELLDTRPDLRRILRGLNRNNEIGKIITRAHFRNYKYSQFVAGTLDADRMDFLLRDSMATGVSYGSIDLKYLLDNINYDRSSKHFYVDFSGIHTLEHFITSRFFLYNVTYHKTVMGFEMLAKHAYYRMLHTDCLKVPTSTKDLIKMAKDDIRFLQFNDAYFWEKIVQWRPRKALDKAVRKALLYRNPPSELFTERVLRETSTQMGRFDVLDANLYHRADFSSLLRKHRIKRSLLFMMENKIKFEEVAPFTSHTEESDTKKEWALCRIFYNGRVQKLVDVAPSIVAHLSQYNLLFKRLYYLPSLDASRPDRAQVRSSILRLRKYDPPPI